MRRRRGHHFGGRFGVGGRPGLAFGRGAWFGGEGVSVPTAPTDISLSEDTFPENTGLGPIAVVTANGNPASTFTIINDPSGLFSLVGGVLNLVAPFDFETQTSHTLEIEATNGVGVPIQRDFTITVTDVVEGTPPTSLQVGFLSGVDNGTSGNLYVDNVNGDNAFDGLTPSTAKETVQAAADIANPGDTIKIRNVSGIPYYETVTPPSGTPGNRIIFEGFGTEDPVISGAQVLSGGVQCTIADEPTVGANYLSIYKVTGLAKTSFPTDNPRAAHVHENGMRMRPCMGRVPNPQYPHTERAAKDHLTADTTVTTGGDPDLITGWQLPSFTDRFTQAQIENCDVIFHRAPNGDTRAPVLSFDPGTKTINLDATGLSDNDRTYESNADKDRFGLPNLLPAMRKGEWGFVDNGATVDLYFWPADPANVASNMEYNAREIALNLVGKSYLEFRSITFRQTAASGVQYDGNYCISAGNSVGGSPYQTDILIENCLIDDTYRDGRSYAPIWARHVNNFHVIQCTIRDAINQYGFFLHGSRWNVYDGAPTGGWLDRCIIERCDATGPRFYGQEDCMITRNRFIDCGQAAHANKGNMYSGGHNGLWWANVWWGCPGYWTYQRTSAQFFGFNFCPANTSDTDGRAIEDQNYDATSDPDQLSPATGQNIPGETYVFNSLLAPFRNADSYTNTLLLGRQDEDEIYLGVLNCITNGSNILATRRITDGLKTNTYTNGTPIDASDVATAYGLVYEDVILGDLAIKSDSPTRAATSTSIATLPSRAGPITLAAKFPNYPAFDRDINNDVLDLANPPVGPAVNPDNMSVHNLNPSWIVRPAPVGAPVVGGSVTCDAGYVMAFGHTALTYQWYLVDDLYDHKDDWTPIVGADAATYTPLSGQISKYLARRTTMGGQSADTLFNSPVVSSFPIGNPVTLLGTAFTKDSPTTSGTWLETAAFTTSNKPVLVIVDTINGAIADANISLTIGTPGRTLGTGTALTASVGARRTRNQATYAVLLSPGSGSQSIQVSSNDTMTNVRVQILEIDGMNTVVAGPQIEASNPTSLEPAITTGQTNSMVLYFVNRYDGTEDPISWGGGTSLYVESTGIDGPSSTLYVAAAYEQAASTGEYSQTASWSASQGAATSFAIEVRAA
ncbi:MAG: hypothetical protein AAFX90_19525 [Pseudomonadota bacterium]